MGVSKLKWAQYFSLSQDKELFQAFSTAGSLYYTPETLPVEVLNPIERFVHSVYGGDRWELFKKKKLSNEGLPPTRTTLIQPCCRFNYSCKVTKSYVEFCPSLRVHMAKVYLALMALRVQVF